jgi:hypothetical protein
MEVAIITTSWQMYRDAHWPTLVKTMAHPSIVDQVVAAAQRGREFIYLATGMSHTLGPFA